MEAILEFMVSNASHAHYIVFACLMLAGLNVPISEDALLLLSGALASAIPDNTIPLFAWAFLGAYLSDWEAYWLGRRLGAAIFETRWLRGRANKRRLVRVGQFYKRYGVWTLFFGRFIPFGVRNCLFMSAGMGRMHFGKFALSDGIACLISNTLLFTGGYYFGKNYTIMQNQLHTYHLFIFCAFLLLAAILILQRTIHQKRLAEGSYEILRNKEKGC